MNLHDLHFLRPWWLLALPTGLLLLAGLKRQEPGKSQWHKVCDSHLLKHLLVGEAKTAQKRIYSGLLLMLSLATLALAGPTWERLPQPLYRAACGRVIVLDLSLSMNAPDITPSRLGRARYKAIDLIKSGIGIEQGLVVFAGDSFIVAPLTDDHATLLNLLPGLDTDTVPVQGSRADRGLEKAGELLIRAAINQGQIILLADDADQQTIAVAQKLNAAGHRIDVIAVGTQEGAPIPLADGSYLKDNRGQIVVPVPAFDKLQEVADSGGGSYLKIDAPESSFMRLNQPASLFPENKSKSELTGDQWLDRGPWLLIPLIILAAICFRKGWLLILLLSLFVNAETAAAQNWDNLWQRPTQQAAKAFANEEFDKAAQLTKDPDWRAAAQYRAGNFKEAATALESLSSSQAHYNRGNALAHSGELEKAIAAYDQALKTDPDLEDARFNRELVEKLLQQQQDNSQNDDSEKDNQEKEAQKNQNSEQNSKDQQKSEQSQDSSEQQDQKENQQSSQNEQSPNNQNQDSQAQNQEQQKAESKPKKTPESKTHKPDDSPEKSIEKTENKGTKKEEKKQPEDAAAGEENVEKHMDAKQQALEQWLRRVPDDPQGLLQKKFLYQYRDRQNRSQGHKEW
ncbi:MAG: VWA domain-containing protein [Deltaproteobacteria bacterium]|nr:VWA domain-containing protein [Candidatus Tharpella sp.]